MLDVKPLDADTVDVVESVLALAGAAAISIAARPSPATTAIFPSAVFISGFLRRPMAPAELSPC
ncbi:MAG: hypothetical protein ABI912_04215 [Actinomycetota bacterium]